MAKEIVMTVRDNVYWVLQKRNLLLGWSAHALYATKAAAVEARRELEKEAHLLTREYKVDRVELIKEK